MHLFVTCTRVDSVSFAPPLPCWGFACLPRHGVLLQWVLPVALFCQSFFAMWYDDARPMLGTNARQGEATNPGPAVSSFIDVRCGITNPTCLANKSADFQKLVRTYDLHLVSMSETAATAAQQSIFAKEMHHDDCKVLWGPPVLPHKNTVGIHEHVRGKASGVGIVSRLAIRPSRNAFPPDWIACTRILHSICQVGPISFQVITVYCKPLTEAASGEYNNRLVEFALQLADMVNIPFVILGDFNMPVSQLKVWPTLSSKGFRDLTHLHLLQKGVPMPFSCADATNADNAIVSPQLAGLVVDIQVLGSEWFATHRPVLFTLRFPCHGLYKTSLRFPKQIIETCVETEQLEEAFKVGSFRTDHPTTLEEWGQQFEDCVDVALRTQFAQQSVGHSHLPRAFRGRCQPTKFVKAPIHIPIKKGWTGHFEPNCEVSSFKAKQMVTQTRRLQSLWNRLSKWEQSDFSAVTFEQLVQEWRAIRRSVAFGKPFLFWIQEHPELGPPCWPIPSADWIHAVLQIVKYTTNCKLASDQAAQRQSLQYRRQLDKKFSGSKAAFRATKGQVVPPLREIRQELSDLVCAAATDVSNRIEIFGEVCHRLDPSFPLLLNNVPCKIVEVTPDFAVVDIPDSLLDLQELELRQTQYAITPEQMAHRLNSFWQPIWQRSPSQADADIFDPELDTLFQEFPPLSADETDMNDPSIWRSAIGKLRPTAARGVDKISAAELKLLPDCLLLPLIAVLNSYVNGFPSWFMIGLLSPIPKTPLSPEAFQIRPITVLAQLYRLWSSVAVCQLLRRLASWAPSGVTGLLPGRGAQTVSYRTQFWLEKALVSKDRLSGVTLDLVKCFNNISWEFGFQLLARLGVPHTLLRQYVASLHRLVRWWHLSGNYVHAGGHSTGFPEGDVWSVLIMVGLASIWVCHLLSSTSQIEVVNLSAYADNWSWAACQLAAHLAALRATDNILQKATLKVDWNKTWYWTTSNQDDRALKAMLLDFSGGIPVDRKFSAVDLGFHLHYSAKPAKGVPQDRLAQGYARIDRVAGLPHDLGVKEHMIRSSVFPCMFHACEIKPPCADELQRVRTRVANALFGNAHNLSPGLALLLTNGGILDPEFWVIWKVISAARDFLLSSEGSVAKTFLYLASQFRGTLNKVLGPASTFGFCLQRMGFSINQFGGLHVKAFVTLQITQISLKRLLRFCVDAWQENLITLMSLRKDWRGLPDISRIDTVAVLSKFPCAHRRLLIRSLAGGYQLQQQKAHWTGEDSNKCPYCDSEDSNSHRLLHCPTGDSVREQHDDVVQFLITEQSCLPDLPVIHVHSSHDYLQALMFKHPIGQFVQTALRVAQDLINRGFPLHWCTDGSTCHPSLPTARFGGYAIVLDTCENDEQRIRISKDFRYLTDLPPSWIPAVCARSHGEQDILRAEMLAIFDILEIIGQGVIHCDSSVAIHSFKTMFAASSPAGFKHCEHFDLLCRAWDFRDRCSCQLVKIKAHQVIASIDNDLDRYWAMGNQVANDLAFAAASRLYPSLASEFHNRASDILENRRRLHQVMQLNLDLQLFRAKLPPPSASLTGAAWSKQQMIDAFQNWNPVDTIPFGKYSTQFLVDSIWGTQSSEQSLVWLELFKWPLSTVGPLNKTTGISWSELALSWMLFNRCILPVVRPDKDGLRRIIFAGSWKSAKDWQITMSELGQACRTVVEHALAMIPEDPLPAMKRGKVPSLYLQGAKVFVSGWISRPVVPCQSEMVQHLQSLFETFGIDNFLQGLPSFHLDTQDDFIFSSDWLTRHKKASSTMKRIRKAKDAL